MSEFVIDGIDFQFPIFESVVTITSVKRNSNTAIGDIGVLVNIGYGAFTLVMLNGSMSANSCMLSGNNFEKKELTVEEADRLYAHISENQGYHRELCLKFLTKYKNALRRRENPNICFHCGQQYEEVVCFDDRLFCPECLDELTFICDHCGERELCENEGYIQGDTVCNSCYAISAECHICHERVYRDDTSIVDGVYVCSECMDDSEELGTCYECGETHFTENMTRDNNDNEYYCNRCYSNAIYSYHYGPGLVFYGDGKYHMGVEIEVDNGNEDEREYSAKRVTRILDKHVYCSNDGSLNTGFEIISHPHTYEAMIKLPWEEAFNSLSADGWRGHETNTAGLHVHVGRRCFDDEDAITRFCTFFENNWAFVRAFSRRESGALERWASRYFNGESETKKFTAKEVKDKVFDDRDRYRAVNLTKGSTIEVRVFRSTLNASTFLATLELVYLVAEKSNVITDEQAEKMSVAEWLKGASDNLLDYCASRGHDCRTTTQRNEEVKLCA